jgi:hypothetical protein
MSKAIVMLFLAFSLAACTLGPTTAPDIGSNCPPAYNGCYAD